MLVKAQCVIDVEAPMASSHRFAGVEVIAKIESIFENIADSLLNEENPYVPLNDIFISLRHKKYTKPNDDTSSPCDAEPSEYFTKVSFPARGRPKEAWRFSMTCHHRKVAMARALIASSAVLIRILDLMHEALCDKVIVSKRCLSTNEPSNLD